MVSIRLSSFVFMLMFTLLEARDSTYYKHNYQGILDTKVAPKSKDVIVRGTPAIVDEETTPHVLETKEEGNDMRLKGRRLATKARISRKSKANEGAGKTRSSEMSGATPSPWNCNHKGKGKLSVSCKQSSVRKFFPHKKAKLPTGFVASSADYNFPNSHPPRHN